MYVGNWFRVSTWATIEAMNEMTHASCVVGHSQQGRARLRLRLGTELAGFAYHGDGNSGQGEGIANDVAHADALPAPVLDPRVFHFAQRG